ncbi:MAG: hypothetical protein JOZ19_00670 [Rubrobacter sp.]|nr:hypothetical protein [Rubrobacter sp.]
MENLLPGHNEQMLKATEATHSRAVIAYARAWTVLERASVRAYKMPYVDERNAEVMRSRQEVPGGAVRHDSRTPILVV